jgi:hypothetical protein
MSDSIITIPMFSLDTQVLPVEICDLLQLLTVVHPEQPKLESKLLQIQNYFRYIDITFSNAHVFYNDPEQKQPYQIEWWLLGKHAKVLGTLVFGRKLPTVNQQSLVRKFWLRRNNNAEFGDLTAAALINTELFDYLYVYDHDEALRLNQYAQRDGGGVYRPESVYRHESINQKNPNWVLVSPTCSAFSD